MAWWCGVSRGLAVLLLLVSVTIAETAQAERLHLPLGRNVDTDLLDQALKISPENLIPFIEAQGIRVHLYPSRRARNPQFKNGQMVTSPLRDEPGLRHVFEDSGGGSTIADAGVFIPSDDDDLGRYGPFIAIAESATTYTLLHEFIHFLFYKTEVADRSAKYSLAERAFKSFKYLGLQLGYGLRNTASSDRHTRDNMVETLITNINLEAERVHWFVAEEVLVESILAKKITSKESPYFSAIRLQQGRTYAAKNIEGARVELAQRLSTWEEIKHSFFRFAGDVPRTSTAEREEIISRIPEYHAEVSKSAGVIEDILNQLAPLVPAKPAN